MPVALIIAALTAFSSLLGFGKVVVEKFVPDRTRKKSRDYKFKRKAVDGLARFRNLTIEEIANYRKAKDKDSGMDYQGSTER